MSFMNEKGTHRGGGNRKGGKGKREKGRTEERKWGRAERVEGNRDTLPSSPVQAVTTGRDHRSSRCGGGPSCPFPWDLDAAMDWWSWAFLLMQGVPLRPHFNSISPAPAPLPHSPSPFCPTLNPVLLLGPRVGCELDWIPRASIGVPLWGAFFFLVLCFKHWREENWNFLRNPALKEAGLRFLTKISAFPPSSNQSRHF